MWTHRCRVLLQEPHTHAPAATRTAGDTSERTGGSETETSRSWSGPSPFHQSPLCLVCAIFIPPITHTKDSSSVHPAAGTPGLQPAPLIIRTYGDVVSLSQLLRVGGGGINGQRVLSGIMYVMCSWVSPNQPVYEQSLPEHGHIQI